MYKGLLLVPCLLATVHASTWNPSNCGPTGYVVGNITDALCCDQQCAQGCAKVNNGTFGSTNAKVQACDNIPVCLWNTETSTCGLNRDRKNNVCVPQNDDGTAYEINQNCHQLTQGYCPLAWTVKRGCCTGNAAKYDGTLLVRNQNVTKGGVTINYSHTTHMCCNLPCEQLAAHNAAQPDLCLYSPDHRELTQCGPAGRSAIIGDDYLMPEAGQDLQLSPDAIQNMFGMNPGKQMSFGIANEGFGFTGMSPQMGVNSLEEIGVGQSKEHHTEEITVDDLMDVLIESLSKDKDVFDYNREINSDPWFQKQAFGGHTDKFSFIDPWKFISQIYGTPFGMSQASTTYGQMYGLDKSSFGKAAPGFENPYQSTMMGGGYGMGGYGMGGYGMGGYGMGGYGMGGYGGMGGGYGGMGGYGMGGGYGAGVGGRNGYGAGMSGGQGAGGMGGGYGAGMSGGQGAGGMGGGSGGGMGGGYGSGMGSGYGSGMGGGYGGNGGGYGSGMGGNQGMGGNYGSNNFGMDNSYGNNNYGMDNGYTDSSYLGMDSSYGGADGGAPYSSTNDYTAEKK